MQKLGLKLNLFLIFSFYMIFTSNSSFAQQDSVKLAWSPNSESNLSHYNLYRDSIPGTMNYLVSIQRPDTTYNDLTVITGQTYYYKLTAVDSAGNESGPSNEVSTTITPDNQAPTVSAGVDQTVMLSDTVQLAGTVTDDGWPNPPGVVTTIWQKLAGPGAVVFIDSTALNSKAAFSDAGIYTLRLTANDGQYSISDDTKITVIDNIPPEAPQNLHVMQ